MIIKNWKRVFTSTFYFLKLFFVSKKYDVVFVSSTSFNRGENGENIFFKPMIECCKKNNLNYVIFEETYFKSYLDYDIGGDSISLDFITILQIISRKIFNLIYQKPISVDEIYFQDFKISNILKNLFFNNLKSKVYITLIWNNVTLWRCLNPAACIIDYQHGYIYDGEAEYMLNGKPPKVKSANNVIALVHGDRYKRILIDNDKSGFYSEENVITVGLNNLKHSNKKISSNNKKILFTLQHTPDFTDEENDEYIKKVENLIEINSRFLSSNNYEIILKHHPRYSKHDSQDLNIKNQFVIFNNDAPISDLFDEVSLHITFHSTSAFDAASIGIPTIFIDMHEPLSPYEMFFKQYNYPCKDCIVENYEDLKNILLNLDDKDIFNKYSNDVHKWSEEFYCDFNEKVFEKFLIDKINNSKDT